MRKSALSLIALAVCVVPLGAQLALAQDIPAPGPAPTTSDTAQPPTSAPSADIPAPPPPSATAPAVDPAASATPPTSATAEPPPPPEPVAPGTPPEADVAPKSKPPQMTLGLEGLVGATGKLDSLSSGYESSGRAGMMLGAGVFFAPDRRFAFGLSFQRSGAGEEDSPPAGSQTSGYINRTYTSVFANARAYPLRSDSIGLWGGLMLGAAWQTAHATGSLVSGQVNVAPRTYSFDSASSAGFAFGLGVGMDFDISNDLAFLASVNLLNYRMTSDPISTSSDPATIPGSGTGTFLDVRAAFQYRFDLGGAKPPVKADMQTSKL